MQSPRPYSWRFSAAVTFATLVLFGALVAWGTWQLRAGLRTGVLQREAEALYAVALMELGRPDTRLATPTPAEAPSAFFGVVLEASRLRGVLAVDLFHGGGQLQNALPTARVEERTVPWWPPAIANPTARFHEELPLENFVGATPEAGVFQVVVEYSEESVGRAALGLFLHVRGAEGGRPRRRAPDRVGRRRETREHARAT